MVFEIGKKIEEFIGHKTTSDHLLFSMFSTAANQITGTGFESINYFGQSKTSLQREASLQCRQNGKSPVPGPGRGYQGGVRVGARGLGDADDYIQKL